MGLSRRDTVCRCLELRLRVDDLWTMVARPTPVRPQSESSLALEDPILIVPNRYLA
jgi:hypothetical protein